MMDEQKRVEERLAARRKNARESFFWGVALSCVALSLPAYQAFMWLQTGVWKPLPISRLVQEVGWKVPSTDWVGLQKIITWSFDLPLMLIPAFVALMFFLDAREWDE
jgi:hypothetical protein